MERAVHWGVNMKAPFNEWCTPVFYRDLAAEFVATFVLMSVQCVLPMSWDVANTGTIIQVSLGMAAIVSAMAWTLGDFGGAHMNPAVTFAHVILQRFTVFRGLIYIAVQCAACIAGTAFIDAITPAKYSGNLAATLLHPDMHPWQGVLVEVWLTFILVTTIHGATNRFRKNVYMFTLIISMAVSIGVSCGTNSTGGSMNPARSLGPAVIRGLWDHHWIYWVGPITGSTLATVIYFVVFDRVDAKEERGKRTEEKDELKNFGASTQRCAGSVYMPVCCGTLKNKYIFIRFPYDPSMNIENMQQVFGQDMRRFSKSTEDKELDSDTDSLSSDARLK